jgi:hypothetical protein
MENDIKKQQEKESKEKEKIGSKMVKKNRKIERN